MSEDENDPKLRNFLVWFKAYISIEGMPGRSCGRLPMFVQAPDKNTAVKVASCTLSLGVDYELDTVERLPHNAIPYSLFNLVTHHNERRDEDL